MIAELEIQAADLRSKLKSLEFRIKEEKRLAALPAQERIAERLHDCGDYGGCQWHKQGDCYKSAMARAAKLLEFEYGDEKRVMRFLDIEGE